LGSDPRGFEIKELGLFSPSILEFYRAALALNPNRDLPEGSGGGVANHPTLDFFPCEKGRYAGAVTVWNLSGLFGPHALVEALAVNCHGTAASHKGRRSLVGIETKTNARIRIFVGSRLDLSPPSNSFALRK